MKWNRIVYALLLATLPACTNQTDVVRSQNVQNTGAVSQVSSMLEGAGVGLPENDVPMVLIPTGEFLMGSSKGGPGIQRDEGPQRQVYLDAYYIDAYEVTTARYAKFLEATGVRAPRGWDEVDLSKHGDRPVVAVTWDEAAAFCRWAGKRLPTEAEWEKAARGTDGRLYPWGNEPPSAERAALARKWDGYDTLSPVGSLEAGKSPYGVHDMSGNAMEWVADWYDPQYYKIAPSSNPAGPSDGNMGIVRGGAWGFLPEQGRSARRTAPPRDTRCLNIGFRCAMDAAQPSVVGQQDP